jgi:hypothetical protein
MVFYVLLNAYHELRKENQNQKPKALLPISAEFMTDFTLFMRVSVPLAPLTLSLPQNASCSSRKAFEIQGIIISKSPEYIS